MAVTLSNSGSQTATLTTWHDVATLSAAPGVYVLSVDASALVNGEVLDIRIKKNTRAADAQGVLYQVSYPHVLADPIIDSPPIVVIDDATFSIRQTGGTGRAFPWALYAL